MLNLLQKKENDQKKEYIPNYLRTRIGYSHKFGDPQAILM